MTIAWYSDFPGGNGCLLELEESAGGVAARFAAEAKNCPQPMWFHFAVAEFGGRPLRVILANPEQTLGGWDWSKNRPVWRQGRGAWNRLAAPERIDRPDGRVEWAWQVPVKGGERIEVAHCYPYQLCDLDETLAALGGAFKKTAIGLTYANRQLPRVFNRLGDRGRPAVYLTARHHAGETPGSWVLDGLLLAVAADKRLNEAITWWAAPIVDLDDVFAGSYGKDPYPHDCNRAYGDAGPRRPEAAAIVPDVRRLKDASRSLFTADLHAPCHGEQESYIPLRGWEIDAPINPIAERFALAFNAAQPEDLRSPIAHVTPSAGANSRYTGLSSTRWGTETLKVDSVSVEISYQGNRRTCYTIQDYWRLGAALAETIAQWVLASATK